MNNQMTLYHQAFLILALICIGTVTTSSAASNGVEWYSYNEGMALGQAETLSSMICIQVFFSFRNPTILYPVQFASEHTVGDTTIGQILHSDVAHQSISLGK